MKTQTFQIQQSILNRALKTCEPALSDNKINPINAFFLFTIDKKELNIRSCDMQLVISTTVAIESKIQAKICMPGIDIATYIGKSDNELLIFEIETHVVPANVETIEHPISHEPQDIHAPEQISYSVWVKSAVKPSNKAKFNAESGEDFPEIQNIDPKPFKIPADDLLELFYKTLYCCSDNDLRPELNGLLIAIDGGKITSTATNTHILASFNADIDTKESATAIIPRQTLQKIQSMGIAGIVDVCISKDVIDFNWNGVKTSGRLIDGTYPDYKSVLPTGNNIDFLTSRTALVKGLSRVVDFSGKDKQVRLNIQADFVELVSDDANYNKRASETVPGALSNGEPILIAVNGNFLLSVLKTMADDPVWLSLSTPNRAMLITESKKHVNGELVNLSLIMPQR